MPFDGNASYFMLFCALKVVLIDMVYEFNTRVQNEYSNNGLWKNVQKNKNVGIV